MRFLNTRLRELRMIAWGLISPRHPVLAHVIPIRRCNLSCDYCNEYDDVSKPVPLEEMFRRIDRLAELGTSIITQSGGEPLLHPDLEQIIAQVRRRGALAGYRREYLSRLRRFEGAVVRNQGRPAPKTVGCAGAARTVRRVTYASTSPA